MDGNSLDKKIQTVIENVNQSIKRSGRSPSAVKLVAVSKTRPADEIRLASALGLTDFGENYPQEFKEKREQLQDLPLRWHFIGRLQSNKVKEVVGQAHCIHSLDRLSLLTALQKQAARQGLSQSVLIQVNVSGEESKAGLPVKELASFLEQLQQAPGVCLRGLMTLPPLQGEPEKNRVYFAKLRDLALAMSAYVSHPHSLQELSMGTSHDYPIAIEEGATMIRVGTQIFGARRKDHDEQSA